MPRSRRDVLEALWRTGGGLLAVAAGWTTFEALRPLKGGDAGGPLPLGPPDSFPEGSATYVREGHLYVTRTKGELFAISQRCPHLGCLVPYCEGSGRFQCPCHGSEFDLAGEWIAGPSPRGLDHYDLVVRDGRVIVDTANPREGPRLGEDKYRTPSRGGSCALPEAPRA
jgi:nitrite reductase/ring-hydroxylating ferredoxin subunit